MSKIIINVAHTLTHLKPPITTNKIKQCITTAHDFLGNLITNNNNFPQATLKIIKDNWQSPNQNINVLIVGTKKAKSLNQKYRQKDYVPNVLSFTNRVDEITESTFLQADVFICYPVVITEAKKYSLPIADRLIHLIVHGFLHTYGLTHDTAKTEKLMEGIEINILQKLNIPNPYFSGE